jgi:hypothetical protein
MHTTEGKFSSKLRSLVLTAGQSSTNKDGVHFCVSDEPDRSAGRGSPLWAVHLTSSNQMSQFMTIETIGYSTLPGMAAIPYLVAFMHCLIFHGEGSQQRGRWMEIRAWQVIELREVQP